MSRALSKLIPRVRTKAANGPDAADGAPGQAAARDGAAAEPQVTATESPATLRGDATPMGQAGSPGDKLAAPAPLPHTPSSPSTGRSLSPKGNRIDFFAKGSQYYWLSNSSEHPVVQDGVKYPTAEHLFQAHKFLEDRPDIAAKVRKAATPSEAVHTARSHASEVRPDWIKDGVNVVTMRLVLLTKFTQHTALQLALLETGDAEIVYASPNDAFWGSAAPAEAVGRGRNVLGKTLVQTRELLRVAAGVGAGSGTRTV